MASWFYLYLSTENTYSTDEITVTVNDSTSFMKGIKRMSTIVDGFNNITIDEATSHWLNVTVKDDEGNAMDLTGCSAVFTACGCGELIEKQCTITDNVVSVKLMPDETLGYLSRGYQIRIFDPNDDVFQIIQGIIYIRKAHKPYIQNPMEEGE